MPRPGAVISLATSASGAHAPRRSRDARRPAMSARGSGEARGRRARADRATRPPRPDGGVQRAAGDRRDRRRRGGPRSGAGAGRRGGAAAAQAEGAISAQRGEQIARHVSAGAGAGRARHRGLSDEEDCASPAGAAARQAAAAEIDAAQAQPPRWRPAKHSGPPSRAGRASCAGRPRALIPRTSYPEQLGGCSDRACVDSGMPNLSPGLRRRRARPAAVPGTRLSGTARARRRRTSGWSGRCDGSAVDQRRASWGEAACPEMADGCASRGACDTTA